MELRTLGGTGLRVSPVGFGASPLGNVFGDVPRDVARATVRRALDLGINFFDTSPYYGGTVSESVLGDCLRFAGVPRDSFVVATKCGRYKEGFDFSAARVTRSVDESLARLGLDYVDILHCHDIEFTNLDQLACRTAADHCRKKGKHITKLAMKYSLMNNEISTVLVGMNSPEQVEENVVAVVELSTSGIDEELCMKSKQF
ncbi:hypothetical protein ZWY2020_058093 [Hordeum vulgare]|nr:hypothetical protein ZWY2020_058093 [Hordeum vulgare]